MKKNLLILGLCATILLTGCMAAVVVGTAAGLIVYDKRSLPVLESDARIFYLIERAIARDPRFHEARVQITSFNQVVLLAGQAPTAFLRQTAETVARNTPNVGYVYNEMTVDFPISYAQRTKDAWITSQVRANLLAEKGLASGSIRVVTENGIVYLMGKTTRKQSLIAANVARQIDGVHKVVKIFQYLPED